MTGLKILGRINLDKDPYSRQNLFNTLCTCVRRELPIKCLELTAFIHGRRQPLVAVHAATILNPMFVIYRTDKGKEEKIKPAQLKKGDLEKLSTAVAKTYHEWVTENH